MLKMPTTLWLHLQKSLSTQDIFLFSFKQNDEPWIRRYRCQYFGTSSFHNLYWPYIIIYPMFQWNNFPSEAWHYRDLIVSTQTARAKPKKKNTKQFNDESRFIHDEIGFIHSQWFCEWSIIKLTITKLRDLHQNHIYSAPHESFKKKLGFLTFFFVKLCRHNVFIISFYPHMLLKFNCSLVWLNCCSGYMKRLKLSKDFNHSTI
jgi:hypothetical protein